MSKNRAKTEAFILKFIDKIAPGGENLAIYKKRFAAMSDEAFSAFIDDLESGKQFLTITAPNFHGSILSVENNLKVAEELGHNFFQRLWIQGTDGNPDYLTPIPYLVIDLPLRRASQLLTKKISVPEHNNVVDVLTGQPTGESKGARVSYPELQVSAAMGMENTMVELMKYRGGDNKGNVALNGMISKYGIARQSTLANYASGVESTNTLRTFLKAMHLKSSL